MDEEEGGKNKEKAIDDSEEDNEERVLMEWSFRDAGSFDLKAISSASMKHCYFPVVSEFTGLILSRCASLISFDVFSQSFFPALTKITVALGPNSGSITDADYHHETLDNL
ncbi:hypothetical protein Bca4012_018834 [Brassica carinata]